MEDDDYFVDRYDCPRTMTNIQNQTLNIEESNSPPSLDIVPRISTCDDEPYEYDDDYDQLYSTTDPTDGAEEYLREIWSQLDVGQQGYLTVSELYRVCEHIGMSVANEDMIEQLFDKLDNDQDGRISFGEFVDGLFKYVHHQYDGVQTCQKQETLISKCSASSSPAKRYNDEISPDHQQEVTKNVSSTQLTLSLPISLTGQHRHHPTIAVSNLLSRYSNFLTIQCDKNG